MNIDIILSLSAALVVVAFLSYWVLNSYSKCLTVWEYESVLHFRNGKLIGLVSAGKHRFWGMGHEFVRFDKRWQEATIQGQEFLTADKASVKVSGLVRYRVADAKKHHAASTQAWQTLYSAVQMALRDVVGTLGLEAVLEREADFEKKLKVLVAPVAEVLGYEIDTVLIRDLMPAGDLKRVLTQVMTAKQESLAGLEKARGEAAAMRVMANAARVFDQNPALMNLRFLQMLESGGGSNNQLILGGIDPFKGLLQKEKH